jgi:ethanolamine ammonia-lyase small subunit
VTPPAVARVIAIDWSGASTGARRAIWLAEAQAGRLRRLESGRDRDEIAAHLIDEARCDSLLVVGLDFAFSFPAWFLRANDIASAAELWALAGSTGEAWLDACAPPFWGRRGRRRPETVTHFRRTEVEAPRVGGIGPKSVFQVGGSGSVGTGSIRGMPLLHQLHAAGWSVWPFDEPGWPRVVEIYPRLLTGAVVKSSAEARTAYLDRHHPELEPALRALAASTEDAFDAAVSALAMHRHLGELERLEPATDADVRLEGAIWYPGVGASGPPAAAAWSDLRALTPARVALGRSGASLPTAPLLDFQLAHARARDAVHHRLGVAVLRTRLETLGLPVHAVRSAARDRREYLARPDLGRRLDPASRAALERVDATGAPELVWLVADGLSALAIERHAPALIELALPRLAEMEWRMGPIVVAEEGRVALGDEVGELLAAKMVAVLIGERPGLSQPDSLGVYLTYLPRVGRRDAERNCISNIRPEGLGYRAAAHRLCHLLAEARRRRLSGVELKDDAPPLEESGGAALPAG